MNTSIFRTENELKFMDSSVTSQLTTCIREQQNESATPLNAKVIVIIMMEMRNVHLVDDFRNVKQCEAMLKNLDLPPRLRVYGADW